MRLHTQLDGGPGVDLVHPGLDVGEFGGEVDFEEVGEFDPGVCSG